jgi:hypothetical protein
MTINRREVLLGSLANGLTLAAGPLSAATLPIPETDLTAGFVTIPVG